MYFIEIAKFCDATLERVLKEVKLKIFETEFWKKPPMLDEKMGIVHEWKTMSRCEVRCFRSESDYHILLYVHVWNILKKFPKWNAAEPIDTDNLQELFGPDPREHPAGKQRVSKKQKSVDTSSAGGSTRRSIGGSQSESVSSFVSQDYRRKCDAAKRVYEAKREKELAMMQCRKLKFLMLDHSSLPPAKRAIIEKKQSEIMRKYPDA
nr:hypothetical protein [Tanacetum cinerariifolium]